VLCYNEACSTTSISIYRKTFQKDNPLPKTNYQYEKRQKELDKKKKKAEKERLKEAKKAIKPEENPAPMPEK
jgi:hypothetical protein